MHVLLLYFIICVVLGFVQLLGYSWVPSLIDAHHSHELRRLLILNITLVFLNSVLNILTLVIIDAFLFAYHATITCARLVPSRRLFGPAEAILYFFLRTLKFADYRAASLFRWFLFLNLDFFAPCSGDIFFKGGWNLWDQSFLGHSTKRSGIRTLVLLFFLFLLLLYIFLAFKYLRRVLSCLFQLDFFMVIFVRSLFLAGDGTQKFLGWWDLSFGFFLFRISRVHW